MAAHQPRVLDLRAAVALGELAEMPKLPPVRKRKRKLPRCPHPEDISALLSWCCGWLRVPVALAAHAGLRSGEVRALEVRDVDLVRGEIQVRRAMSAGEVTTTKSDEERTVPIAPELRPVLEAACQGKRPSDRVVRTERGTTPSRQNVLDRLTRVQVGTVSRGTPSTRSATTSARHCFGAVQTWRWCESWPATGTSQRPRATCTRSWTMLVVRCWGKPRSNRRTAISVRLQKS